MVTVPLIGLSPGGPPVGLFPDATWRERVVRLHPGDLALAYTDGVTEASSPSGQEWGIGGPPPGCGAAPDSSPRTKSFDRFLLQWTSFPEASRRTTRRSGYCESSENEICSPFGGHRHAVETSAEKLAIAKRMGADEVPGV